MKVSIRVALAAAFLSISALLACSQQVEDTREIPSVQEARELDRLKAEHAPTGHDLPFVRVSSNVFRVHMGDNEGLFLIQTGCVVTDVAVHEPLMTYVCEPESVQGWIEETGALRYPPE